MSVSGISATSSVSSVGNSLLSKTSEIQKEFVKLGKDLQSGDLSAAQSDYVALEHLVPKLESSAQGASAQAIGSSHRGDPRVQAFAQLEKDIQSGNLSAAQQDYSNIQQALQQRAERFHHHQRVDTGVESTTSSESDTSPTTVSVSA